MAHAHKGKKKVSKAMGAILKAPKKAEKVVKAAVKWDTIEEFTIDFAYDYWVHGNQTAG